MYAKKVIEGAQGGFKTCTQCGQVKVLAAFSKESASLDGKHSSCKMCHLMATREWKRKNAYSHDTTTYYQRLRSAVIKRYGSKCSCCGEAQVKFLAFDHKNNDGHVSRRANEPGIKNIAFWIRKNNYPDTIQLLCHNCNLAKGFYGLCPHNENSEAKS